MATPAVTMVPLNEWLTTSYEHDCEWIDGELRERGMPDEYHSAIQAFFLVYFAGLSRALRVRARTELRVRVAPRRYRIPDVLLLAADAPLQPIPDSPPLLCIEILSPDDSMSEMQEKIADYLTMGVKSIWIVDPRRRALFQADDQGTHPVSALRLVGRDVVIHAAEIFAELDELERTNESRA